MAPSLAVNWDSPDGKTWSFELQDGVTFSNGEAFTSEDVVYSFDRLKSKDSPMAECTPTSRRSSPTTRRTSPSS